MQLLCRLCLPFTFALLGEVMRVFRLSLGVLSILCMSMLLILACENSDLSVTQTDAGIDATTEPETTGTNIIIPEGEWTFNGELSSEQLENTLTNRLSIEKGLLLGKNSYTQELNRVLVNRGITFGYQGTGGATGGTYIEPDAGNCPFLDEARTPGEFNCRELSRTAKMTSHSEITFLLENHPLDIEGEVSVSDENKGWYEAGVMTGIDNEMIFSTRYIRMNEVCDQQPSRQESSYERGVEVGRELYVSILNQHMEGSGNVYPDSIQVIEVCEADQALLVPVKSKAIDEIENTFVTQELCADFIPQNQEQERQYTDALSMYEQGIRNGINEEHSLASEIIYTVVPCNVSDPLVVDLNGDGIHLKPISDRVTFDLFDWGEKVRTNWIQGDDAFIVFDKNGNGMIDNGREMFANFVGERGWNGVPTGFDHLAQYDKGEFGGNENGLIDSLDKIFSSLGLWQDLNGDGVSQPNELYSLGSIGINAIDLNYTTVGRGRLPIPHKSTFVRNSSGLQKSGSVVGQVYDVWFTTF